MKDEELKGFPTEEQIDFVIDLKRKITLEKGFCTDADIYLAGLKAGRPQWHDLRKDPNDLPKKNGEYFCKVDYHWEKYGVKHFTLQPYGYNRQWEGQGYSVIAWCELPTFDKE